MCTLLTRKEIIQSKPIIGSEIIKLQKAFFDHEILQDYINEEEEGLYRETFDCISDATVDYKVHHTIIGINHTDIRTFTSVLSNKLKELFQIIHADEFYVLSHLKLDFFGNRKNRFTPLVKAYKKLEGFACQSTYKEAFLININELAEFTAILFWLTRCDPQAPEYIFLFAKNEKAGLFICKYGNIHLTETGNRHITNEKLISSGWEIIKGNEFDRFSDDGIIEGRRISL